MASRAWHAKTRNGCGQCKKRRVRCDLRAPICSNCERRKEQCDYQFAHPTAQTGLDATHENASSSSQLGPALMPNRRTPSPTMAQFPRSPAALLAFVDDEAEPWNATVRLAIRQHVFLQHAFRALFTLYDHRGSPSETKQGYIDACAHQIEASRDFRLSAPVATSDNQVGSIVFALTVIVFQLRAGAIRPDRQSLVETVLGLRNAAQLLQSIAPLFTQKQMRKHERPPGTGPSPDPQMLDAIFKLETMASGYGVNGGLEETYSDSIKNLRHCAIATRGSPRVWADLVGWPASLSSHYVSLLSEDEPMAVVIFLYWCAIMVNAPKKWFLDDWATKLAMQAFSSLEPSWKPLLSWPSLVFGFDGTETNKFLAFQDNGKEEVQ